MEQLTIDNQLVEIQKKLDFITDFIEAEQRHKREMKELRNDMTLIGRDVFQTAVRELDDVSAHFDTEDLLALFKKLLRNTRNLSRMLEQVEGAFDLYQDLKPLGKQMFNELLATLDEFDRKGYFEFMKASVQIVDEIVTSFEIEDVHLLRENIVSIMMTVKNLTQPEMLGAMNNALGFFQKMDVAVDRKVSWGALFKEFRDPEVKRGMMYLLEFAKNIAKSNGSDNNKLKITNKEK